MMILCFLAPLLGRKADVLSALAFAAILILIYSPLQLYNVGFIYSFLVVLGIILFCPAIEQSLKCIYEKDPMQLEELSRFHSFVRLVVQKTVSIAVLSIVAWLVSAPLTLYFFGRFAPVALISNVFVVPLVFLIVTTGCLSLCLGSLAGIFAVGLNNVNLLLVRFLLWIMGWLCRVPYGSIQTGKISIWIVFLWYAVLLLLFFCIFRKAGAENNHDTQA